MQPGTVLYAEDEPTDIFFLQRAFTNVGIQHRLESVPDGEAAIEYLSGADAYADREKNPLPCLILLDINMPRLSGLEVLEWMRKQPQLKKIPVLMLTSSSHPADMERARRLEANEYLTKPSNPAKLVELVRTIQKRWLS
jgi:CheY-like chemotaxis protein